MKEGRYADATFADFRTQTEAQRSILRYMLPGLVSKLLKDPPLQD